MKRRKASDMLGNRPVPIRDLRHIHVLALSSLFLFSLCESSLGQSRQESKGESSKAEYKPSPNEKRPTIAEAVDIVIRRTNEFRGEEKREPVEPNSQLTATAQYFADFMARTDKYGHTADGDQPSDRAKKHDYEYCIVSENIAYRFNSEGFTTKALGDGFFTGWKNSPEHRENMVDPDVTETGVAIARSEKTGYYYGVQMFGRPKSLMVEFQIANQADATIKYEIEGQEYVLEPRHIRTHQRCRAEEMLVQWPGDQKSTKAQIRNGDHFAIVRDEEGTLKLRNEKK